MNWTINCKTENACRSEYVRRLRQSIMVILMVSNRNCETRDIKITNVFGQNVYMVIAEAGYVNREEKKKSNFMCPRRNARP